MSKRPMNDPCANCDEYSRGHALVETLEEKGILNNEPWEKNKSKD